jgi:hypothetical protein
MPSPADRMLTILAVRRDASICPFVRATLAGRAV